MSPQQTRSGFEFLIGIAFVVAAALVLTASVVHSAVRPHDESPAAVQLGERVGGPQATKTALERALDGPYGPAVRLQLEQRSAARQTQTNARERALHGPYGPAVRLQLAPAPGGSAVTPEK